MTKSKTSSWKQTVATAVKHIYIGAAFVLVWSYTRDEAAFHGFEAAAAKNFYQLMAAENAKISGT